MEHGAVCTSQKDFGSRIGMTPEVRILQFATHVFDVCVSDIIGSLLFGACHCVPSEHIRMNALATFIQDQKVNWAILTPTFARTLRPEDVPSLKVLVVGGEANGKDILNTWFVTPELDRNLEIDFGKDIPAPTSQVTPDDPAYILFTSGSTGVPKGLVMEHGALCTSQIASAKRLRLTRDVRMLQFAAFVFDLSIVSADNAGKCSSLVSSTIVVTAALDQILTNELGSFPPAPACGVTPDHAAYVLFTSGSTGTPKGLVMEHVAVCTSQTAISRRLRLTPQVRMLQFASFVFDLCIGEIVSTLISGATLCVPSEDIRLNGLQQFVRDFNITWAFLTPAFVRTLRPKDFPTLELLLLAGEAVSTDLLNTWFGKVRFVNGWGPAETSL
ncbi:hypothetical protein ACLOAV_004668 [Pseudogymnoascus australis]